MNTTFGKKNWYVLLLFGLIGQIAWSVENMYFNLFVYDTIQPNLSAVTIMVQASGIAATLVTLVAGTLSDKVGNRRSFISWGYIIWGVTVALFGFMSPELTEAILGVEYESAVKITLVAVIVGDCVMTLFGSTANDAAFNAWITDNTKPEYRGKVESVISILPLAATLIVAGGFGILVEALGYSTIFLILGIVISICGVVGIYMIKDADHLEKSGTLADMLYGFKPSSVKSNKSFYVALLIVGVYGIACQVYMPYLIIYMREFLKFSVLEYSAVFAVAIIFGAVINIFAGKLADKMSKASLMYVAAGVFALGLFAMYLSNGMGHVATLLVFGVSSFIMLTGFIFISALSGAIIRDNTPESETGKLQGVRMIFSVLIPMIVGPSIGNAINKAEGIVLENAGADAMTTSYIPAPGIFLAASLITLLLFALIPLLQKTEKQKAN